jgi:hypothetical protein
MKATFVRLSIIAALAAALGGCTDGTDRDRLAGTQGRACQAVEYAAVETALGVRFDSAAGAQVDQTYSCVLHQAQQSFPELAVTMSVTPADEVIYRVTAWPSNATSVEELGRVAYQLSLPAGTATGQDGVTSGPALQVGWLSAGPQMMTLRYTFAAGASDADVAALAARLLSLARSIEATLVGHPALG